MGLSATQMRFLMVTARKSNVEYQGQQINQARTDLANQSSALYSELLSLKAPTAPSKYTYVINPVEQPAIDWSNTGAYPLTGDKQKEFLVYYSANEPKFVDFNIPYAVLNEDGSASVRMITGKDKDGKNLYSTVDKTPDELKSMTYYYQTEGKDGAGNNVTYTAIHVNENEFYKYNIQTGLFCLKEDTDKTMSDLPDWVKAYNDAKGSYLTYSSPKPTALFTNEEYTRFKEASPNASASEQVENASEISLSATVSYNDAQYAAALAQYEIDLEEYEKAYAEINMKTEEIHEADKKLELQLKQLDTEQEAIQTEYEALKKVLEKNIENTFKTFG